MKARLAQLASLTLTAWLLIAVPAFASDNGEGLLGETNDKVITFFSLGVVVFFAVLVTLLSWLQATLDKRKEQRKGAKVRDVVGW
jgi:hypothetical protein